MFENVDEFLLCRTYVGITALAVGRLFVLGLQTMVNFQKVYPLPG